MEFSNIFRDNHFLKNNENVRCHFFGHIFPNPEKKQNITFDWLKKTCDSHAKRLVKSWAAARTGSRAPAVRVAARPGEQRRFWWVGSVQQARLANVFWNIEVGPQECTSLIFLADWRKRALRDWLSEPTGPVSNFKNSDNFLDEETDNNCEI